MNENNQDGLYQIIDNNLTVCLLCPHCCRLKHGETGKCKSRKNIYGKIELTTFGKVTSMHLDPVEKKPLYHFFPGRYILSVGTTGCNFSCFFCQNHEISQVFPNENIFHHVNAETILAQALQHFDNIGIAYTYNEPIISFEFYYMVATLVASRQLKNVFVSNGYINPKPLEKLTKIIDAWNIDLKGFSEEFYKTNTGGSLQPVLNTLKNIRKSGKHLEITNLIIPGLNDNPELFLKMVEWIKNELGPETPLHLSRYFPRYRSQIAPTAPETLKKLYEIAAQHLSYVYLGNIYIPNTSDTLCPKCKSTAIARTGYEITTNLDNQGRCKQCSYPIALVN